MEIQFYNQLDFWDGGSKEDDMLGRPTAPTGLYRRKSSLPYSIPEEEDGAFQPLLKPFKIWRDSHSQFSEPPLAWKDVSSSGSRVRLRLVAWALAVVVLLGLSFFAFSQQAGRGIELSIASLPLVRRPVGVTLVTSFWGGSQASEGELLSYRNLKADTPFQDNWESIGRFLTDVSLPIVFYTSPRLASKIIDFRDERVRHSALSQEWRAEIGIAHHCDQ